MIARMKRIKIGTDKKESHVIRSTKTKRENENEDKTRKSKRKRGNKANRDENGGEARP